MSFKIQPPAPARPNRCQLFGPGSRPAIFEKMAASAADVINLDLEDSVAPSDKDSARANIIEAISSIDWGNKTLSVRINGLDTPYWYRDVVDLLEQAGERLDQIMIPKVGCAGDIYAVDALVTSIEAAKGRSNQSAVVLDSTGRAYTLPTHNLPSARGQGEPLTGRINPPSGAGFKGLLLGDAQQRCLLASDAGYGFITTLGELNTKNRAGKAALTLPAGAEVTSPVPLFEGASWVAAVSNEGRLLLFPLSDLPSLSRGKGNKIISIPSARAKAREEFVVAIEVLGDEDALTLWAGKRHLTLKRVELDHYRGERGRRGNKLPRGFQRVERIQRAD